MEDVGGGGGDGRGGDDGRTACRTATAWDTATLTPRSPGQHTHTDVNTDPYHCHVVNIENKGSPDLRLQNPDFFLAPQAQL